MAVEKKRKLLKELKKTISKKTKTSSSPKEQTSYKLPTSIYFGSVR